MKILRSLVENTSDLAMALRLGTTMRTMRAKDDRGLPRKIACLRLSFPKSLGLSLHLVQSRVISKRARPPPQVMWQVESSFPSPSTHFHTTAVQALHLPIPCCKAWFGGTRVSWFPVFVCSTMQVWLLYCRLL